jgi:ribosomal protein L32
MRRRLECPVACACSFDCKCGRFYSGAMIVCPVCEHQQSQGTACDVCGKALVASQPINVAREVLPELESNILPGADANVVIERMAEIDEYRASHVQIAFEPMPELERTEHAEVALAAVEPVPDFERTSHPGDGQRTPVSAVRRCRYCGHTQQTGFLCDGCGLRMPGTEMAGKPAAHEEPTTVACPDCGVTGSINSRCLACGAYLRAPSI